MSGLPPVPLFGPITLDTSEALREAKGGLVKSAPYLAAGIAIANADEILEITEDLLADALRTLTVTSQHEFCGALRAWGRDLEHLAEVILSPVADASADLVQMLAIEVLRIKFARLASMLSLAGAIVDNPHVGAHFDLEKLRDFMLATPDLVDESFWDELFGAGDDERPDAVAARCAAHRGAGDARRAEHGRSEDRAARAAADGRDALVAGMDCAARAQRRLDPDHAAVDRRRRRRPPRGRRRARPARRVRSRARDQPPVPLAAPPLRRPHCHRLRDVGAPERRRRALRGSHLERLHRRGRPGCSARARLRRRQRDVERRHRAAHGHHPSRSPGTRRRSRSGATHRATSRTSSSGRPTTRASSRATSALDAESARAGRAERRGDRDDRRASASCSPTAGSARSGRRGRDCARACGSMPISRRG